MFVTCVGVLEALEALCLQGFISLGKKKLQKLILLIFKKRDKNLRSSTSTSVKHNHNISQTRMMITYAYSYHKTFRPMA